MANFGKAQSLLQQINFWEKKPDSYRRTLSLYQEYIDHQQDVKNWREAINGYIRMAGYAERMDDVGFSQNLYREAIRLIKTTGTGSDSNVNRIQRKIMDMQYFH